MAEPQMFTMLDRVVPANGLRGARFAPLALCGQDVSAVAANCEQVAGLGEGAATTIIVMRNGSQFLVRGRMAAVLEKLTRAEWEPAGEENEDGE